MSLAWSQDHVHVSVGLRSAEGNGTALTIDSRSMRSGDPVSDPRMLPETVVVSAAGRLAWLRGDEGSTVIVEVIDDGLREAVVPADLVALQWTAVDYAAVERTGDDGSRVLMIDIDRPADPTVLFETDRQAEALWVTPDPEWVVVGVAADAAGGAPAGFIVVGPTLTRTIEAPGYDGSQVSMTQARNWLVYRDPATGRMQSVATGDGQAQFLTEQPVRFGAVSGKDVLGFASTSPGEVCVLGA